MASTSPPVFCEFLVARFLLGELREEDEVGARFMDRTSTEKDLPACGLFVALLEMAGL